MNVELWPISRPVPYAKNPRRNDGLSVSKLKASIKEFGFKVPIICDANDVVVAGHTRLKAAIELNLTEVPVVIADDLTPAQIKAFRIADNRVAEQSSWDTDLLMLELDDLKLAEFDLALTAFDPEELNAFRAEPVEGLTEDDAVPEAPVNPISKPGDVWLLGNNRLMCGSATETSDVMTLIGDTTPQMVYTDPPYGISIVKGNKVGGGGAFGGKKNELKGAKPIEVHSFAPIIGDETVDTAVAAYEICRDLAISTLIFWGGNHYAEHLPSSSCWLVWDKENTGNFADAELAWTNQKTAVRLFRHMWNGMVKASERGERRVHPTQKPVALAEWCFSLYGSPGDTVLDLFGGSGSTMIACEKSGHLCQMMELSPAYCDVIIRRWQAFTGKQAIHENGTPFDQI